MFAAKAFPRCEDFDGDDAVHAKPRLTGPCGEVFYPTPADALILDATAGTWCSNAGHGRAPLHVIDIRTIHLMVG